jgi:hypothetical protein
MGAELIGKTAALEYVNRQIDEVRLSTRREVIDFCIALMGRAAQYAPVDQGDLRGSFVLVIGGELWALTESDGAGGVSIVRDERDPPLTGDMEIYVGTAGCVYALRQHEELTWNHPKGGQAKFMEQAFNELIATLYQRLNGGG